MIHCSEGGKRMFCMHCGTENSDTAKFCYKCGSRLYPQENETAQSPTGSEPWDDGEEVTVLLKRNVETQNRQMEKETLSEETPDSQKGQPDPHGAAYFQEDFIPDGFVPMTSRPEDRKQKEKQAKAKAPRKGKKRGILIAVILLCILAVGGGTYIYANRVCSAEACLGRIFDKISKGDIKGAFDECVWTSEEQAQIEAFFADGSIEDELPDGIELISMIQFEKLSETAAYMDPATGLMAKDMVFQPSLAGFSMGEEIPTVELTFVRSTDKFLGLFPKWKLNGASLETMLDM